MNGVTGSAIGGIAGGLIGGAALKLDFAKIVNYKDQK